MSVEVKMDFGYLKEENAKLRTWNKILENEKKFLVNTLAGFMKKPMESIINDILDSEVELRLYLRGDIEKFYDGLKDDEMYKSFEKYINESRDTGVNALFYMENDKNISLMSVYKEFINSLKEGLKEETVNEKMEKIVVFVRRNYNLKKLLEY